MRLPIATYRIQFNPDFDFDQARAIAPYLSDLGVSDLYASPIFKARTGSTHGYDVVDAAQFNPQLGGETAFNALSAELHHLGLGWVQDIVPNHMAYSSENAFLMDVLETGSASSYADYFDLCWNSPFGSSQARILAPLLGDFYGAALERGEIQLAYDPDGLSVNYYDLKLPLRLESYTKFLTHNLGHITRTLGRDHPDLIKLLGILYLLKSVPQEASGNQLKDQMAFIKGLLWELYTSNDIVHRFVDDNLNRFNGNPEDTESYTLLDEVLNEQFYRITFWKVGAEEMNYRRFFTVNELISVKVEEPRVFNNTHALIQTLVDEEKFTGLRVDHIDGLYDPTQYLERLRDNMGDTYITVEKILELSESLPSQWSIQGTSGYEFLNYVNGVFCQRQHEARMDEIYTAFLGYRIDYAALVREKKQLIIDKNLAGDIDNLAVLLKAIASRYRYGNDFTLNGLQQAIAQILVAFPVYRTYVSPEGMSEGDRACIQAVISTAQAQTPLLQNEFTFIQKVMLLEFDATLTQAERDQWLYFVMRMQQYSGPLMAKGVEDTTLYVYNRLLSLNEVGGNPGHFGISVNEFHAFNQRQQETWPHTMTTTATHDTKRGEDMRARLNVLSEIPDEWEDQVNTWSALNRDQRGDRQGLPMPDRNDEYFLYQTLVGAYPIVDDHDATFVKRIQEYVIKAIREAKVHTAWLRPDQAYEEACLHFIEGILDPAQSDVFLSKFKPFQQRIAHYGMWNSLSQLLLRLAAPGIPDVYQGTELWELSLVDPDNRRPVDFDQRQRWLIEIQKQAAVDRSALLTDLLSDRSSGKVKLFLLTQLLHLRQQRSSLFLHGTYQPLEVQGSYAHHLIAFARHNPTDNQWAIALAPRFFTSLIAPGEVPVGEAVWQDTKVVLPANAPSEWHNVLTGRSLSNAGALPVSAVLEQFPTALLVQN